MPGVKVSLISFFILVFGFQTFAQTDTSSIISQVESQIQKEKAKHKHSARNSNNAWLITPYYTALLPVGILSQRFGFSNDVGLDISYKVKGWLIGLEGDYMFGSRVKEDPITNSIGTYTAPTQIIGLDGTLLTPTLELSGFEIAFKVGKLISFTPRKHPNSGLVVSLAPGYIQHKIQITANTDNYPQLDPTYKKGYDRLTSGGMVEAYLGYMFLERKKFLSFSAGIDYTLGITQERRNWDFDLMSSNTGTRYDMLIGFKVAWVIPVFTNKDNKAYY